MRIVFRPVPVPDGECVTTFHRRDGVVVTMPSYSRRWRVSHNLVRAVAERELSIADDVCGSVAAGAMFANVRVVPDRPTGRTLEFFRPDRLVKLVPSPRARRSPARLAPSRG